MRRKQFTLLGVMSLSLITACRGLFSESTCHSREFNVIEGDFEVNTSLFLTSNSNDQIKKLLIILPPTGGTNFIDRSYAKMFCQNGYQVITLNSSKRAEGT
jgi:hypothetical protein